MTRTRRSAKDLGATTDQRTDHLTPATVAACAILARIAWPYENDDCQAEWASKIATNPDIGRNTYRRALAKSEPEHHHGDATLREHVEMAGRRLRDRGINWIDL